MKIKLWAIKQISTGHCLPEVHKSYTHSGPADPKYMPPRLFTTEGGAKRALKAWLKGKHYALIDNDEYGSSSVGVGKIDTRHTRDPADWCVVLLLLTTGRTQD